MPPRRDLELDALLEVVRGKRLVHCHSYRQDEILAMMRVAEEYGFRIKVFQHILEGYKVADVMAKHGAGGSSFSDWWAYKLEVYDAIPHNGALIHGQGVLVSFNSDSDELGRPMNLEAAKAVRYGGVGEEEALRFVTINAAKQLMVDRRVGSLEAGKDADFVIWVRLLSRVILKIAQYFLNGFITPITNFCEKFPKIAVSMKNCILKLTNRRNNNRFPLPYWYLVQQTKTWFGG